MRAAFAALVMSSVLACAAQAEIAMTGDGRFGLGAPDAGKTSPESGQGSSAPSFQQLPQTGIVLSGSGRFGLLYEDYDEGGSDVTVSTRLRLDIDVHHETDGGVTFGGRIRAQGSAGSGTMLSPPSLYATWN